MKKILLVMTIIISLLFFPTGASAGTNEAFLLSSINAQREARGLSTLTVNDEMTHLAVEWSKVMAEKKTIFHSDLVTGVTQNWVKLGENVGRGSSAASVASAFIASPLHLENIIDPEFNNVGVGITEADGTLYIVQRFMDANPQIVPKPIPVPTIVVVPPTTIATLPPTPSTTPVIPSTTTTEPVVADLPKVASPVNNGSIMKRMRQLLLKYARIIRAKLFPFSL